MCFYYTLSDVTSNLKFHSRLSNLIKQILFFATSKVRRENFHFKLYFALLPCIYVCQETDPAALLYCTCTMCNVSATQCCMLCSRVHRKPVFFMLVAMVVGQRRACLLLDQQSPWSHQEKYVCQARSLAPYMVNKIIKF